MSLNFRDNQPENAQQKSGAVSQGQASDKAPDKTSQAEQGNEAFEKVRKDKKQKSHQAKWDRREDSTPTSETNTTPVKKKQARSGTFPRSPIITATKKAIMPPTAMSLRQKNSSSLGNLHVGDYEFGG